MHLILFLNLAAIFGLFAPAIAEDRAVLIENTFRNAIVKIDVSSNTPVLENGRNVCRSEGTGFFVSKSHIITANHVLDIKVQCGEKIIMIKSRKHNLQKLASVVDSSDDVALLRLDSITENRVCSLIFSPQDTFSTYGFRFGIPEGLEDPDPAELRIGEEDGQFAPLVVLTPATTHRGDSGGPVIKDFNVVGITKARHEKFNDRSFMIRGTIVRALMTRNNVETDGSDCNPAKYWIVTTPGGKRGYYTFMIELVNGQGLSYESRKEIVDQLTASAVRHLSASKSGQTDIKRVSVDPISLRVAIQLDPDAGLPGSPDDFIADIRKKMENDLWQSYFVELRRKRAKFNIDRSRFEPLTCGLTSC